MNGEASTTHPRCPRELKEEYLELARCLKFGGGADEILRQYEQALFLPLLDFTLSA